MRFYCNSFYKTEYLDNANNPSKLSFVNLHFHEQILPNIKHALIEFK